MVVEEPVAESSLIDEHNNRKYLWERFKIKKKDESGQEKDEGLLAIRTTDLDTGAALTITPDEHIRRAAHRAWAGARQSRAPGTTVQILAEMGQRGVDPDQKLEEMFSKFGHASVADMARFEVSFHNVPGHLPLSIFHLGRVNSGQEKSTRYQSAFGSAALHPLRHYLNNIPNETLQHLDQEYQNIGIAMQKRFLETEERIKGKFATTFAPTTKQEEISSHSRALDTARSLLLLGASTGFTYETSAREWSSRISMLRSMPSPYYAPLADQLERTLAPPSEIENELRFLAEAPSLIKHTEPDSIVAENISRLCEFMQEKLETPARGLGGQVAQSVRLLNARPSQQMIAQYLTAALPGLDPATALAYARDADENHLRELSKIVFHDHSKYREPPQIADTTGLSAILTTSLGEARDFNRHRAFARYLNGWSNLYGTPLSYERALAILNDGFTLPLYLELPGFESDHQCMITDLTKHYARVHAYLEAAHIELGDCDYTWLMNLLPMAHRTDLWMHGTPHQLHYLTHLRVREGGHINYRMLAYDLNKIAADTDPALEGLRLSTPRPDPASRTEFYLRV